MKKEWKEATEEESKLPIEHIEGDSIAYVNYIKANWDNTRMVVIDGKFRWIVQKEDGTEVIVRPSESK